MREEELLKKLRAAFKMEAEERLAAISSGLLELEKILDDPQRKAEILEEVFREAHSLKGASRAVNLVDIENLCQPMESIFSALKKRKLSLFPELFDTLHSTLEVIEELLHSPDINHSQKVTTLFRQLEDLRHSKQDEIEQDKIEQDKIEQAEIEQAEIEQIEIEQQMTEPKEKIPKEKKSESQKTKIIKSEDEQTGDEKKALSPKGRLKKENNHKVNISDIDEQNHKIPSKEPIKVQTQLKPKPKKNSNALQKDKPIIAETVRISVSKLDSLMLKVEELVSLKLAGRQHLTNIKDIIRSFDSWKKHWASLETEFRWLRRQEGKKEKSFDSNTEYLTGILEFLEFNQDHVKLLESKIKSLTAISEQNQRSLSTMVNEVLDDMKKVTMLPFSTLSVILPKMVREISRDQHKDIDLIIEGSELEIDRRILEEMKDPLIHLLRNSIDHGLETPEDRQLQKKSGRGTIRLTISQNLGNKVEIIINDDGKGIDVDEVKSEAVKRGIVSKNEVLNMDDKEAMSLIFRSELSTSPIITQISGRGLGLAIVQGKVQQLGGILDVDSQKGLGTTFTIQLPVTLATSRGILIRVNKNYYVVPVTHIERVIRVKWEDVKTVENKATIPLNGGVLSFVNLSDILEVSQGVSEKDRPSLVTVMVLEVGVKQIAFRVDEVLGEQEVLVKSLGKQLSRVRNIAGATILGSGKVVPILNVHDLLLSTSKTSLITPVVTLKDDDRETDVKTILVAEDSITSRMLIQNILESAGYTVKTAVDGYDAYTIFKTEDFDLVVTDVEMPRMDGFELTRQIRADNKRGETPVVLVTSLQSPEDRKQGIDAGANAYIVKSNFDQSNLLEVIERLI